MAKNNKPYTRNSKTFNKKDDKKNKKKNKNIDNSPQVRMDQERINDIEILDKIYDCERKFLFSVRI